jgi:hypothetical protein
MARIPEPEYLHETLDGMVYDLPEGTTLMVGPPPPVFASYAPRLASPLVLRYGIPLQTPASHALIPGLFVSERGVALVGQAAWTFMLDNFQLYPRADVIGFRAHNGTPLQVFLRELDFGAGIRLFAYESVDVTLTPAHIDYVQVNAAVVELPPLLTAFVRQQAE